jgi:cytochrome-b5 reductase
MAVLTYSLLLFTKVISQQRLSIIRTMSSATAAYTMPSSMNGPPVKSLVPPGLCQFTGENIEVALLERTQVSPTAAVLRFGLPDPSKPLNLSTCACILATAEMNGESITRPYTPISTNAEAGHFDLLVKHYGPTAHMSRFMHEMVPGDKIAFKHIGPNVKTQAPFPYKKIGMLVGGTGITPMTQALHAILGDTSDGPHVTMIYGSRKQEDILGKELVRL